MPRPLPVVASGFIACTITGPGHAEPDIPVRLAYTAPDTCPPREEFLRQLVARTDRVRVAAVDERAEELAIEIERGNGGEGETEGYVGSFARTEGVVYSERRFLAAADCAELVRALSFTAALSFDPAARLEIDTEPAAPPATSGSAAFPAPVGSATPRVDSAAVPAPAPTEMAPAPRPLPPARRRSIGMDVVLGARIETQTGVAENIAFIPRALVGLELQRHVRFTVAAGTTGGRAETDVGSARFRLTTVRGDACVTWYSSGLFARPCVGMDGGSLHVSPRGEFDRQASSTKPWLAPFVGVRGGWRMPQPSSSWSLEFEALGAATAPLVRSHYYFTTDGAVTDVHTVPPLGVIAGIGALAIFGDRTEPSRQ